jgi:hypothetical protein
VANEMKVNPLLPGMLYAYPNQGGIVPIMGPDGVFKKLMEHPDVESWDTDVFPEDASAPPTHAITLIRRRSTRSPLKYTAYFAEWKMDSNPNWRTRPRHMLGLRSLKQAARQIIHGIPFDEDERRMMNVTGTGGDSPDELGSFAIETPPERPTPPARRGRPPTKGLAASQAQTTPKEDAEVKDAPMKQADVTVIQPEEESIDAFTPQPETPTTPARDRVGVSTVGQDGAEIEYFDPRTSLVEEEILRGKIKILSVVKKPLATPFRGQSEMIYLEIEGAFKGKAFCQLFNNELIKPGAEGIGIIHAVKAGGIKPLVTNFAAIVS